MYPHINSNRDLRLFFRDLNADRSKGEALLWYGALKAKKMRGYQFHRHYPVGDSMVDFICVKLNFIIEIQGELNYSELSTAQKRREELVSMGYLVLNFSESEVVNQLDEVVERIGDAVDLIAENLNLQQ